MKIAPLPELRTARLVLEPLRVDHAAEMVDVLADPALYTSTGGEPPDLHRNGEARRRRRADLATSGQPTPHL